MARQSNKLRIIGGQWRSRQLSFPDAEGLRPTTDRIRETVFNWLQPVIHGARCLDLFSGSGAMGFEALSRGAASVVMVDLNPKVVRQLKENVQLLATRNAQVVQADCLQYLSQANGPFDVIFLDPPFAKDMLQSVLERIEKHALLASGGYVYVECERQLSDLRFPPHWQLHREREGGQVRFSLYQNSAGDEASPSDII
ncbi:MAG: 16S rRNA (guanine(966)-N(2))-methyltransferase RsmD [Oceanospirillaceae bacterium]|nr:16S rRNA (guanine(966)-N(2))-methyltransferase RsmD [Oceanospirillaceae bacterium]